MPKLNVNGLEMYYEEEGSGPPVVLISGLSQDHLGWAMQVPALAAAGYRCVALDNRDAGQTGQSRDSYTIRQFAEDTVGLMDGLGIAAAHIVGASMGGMIAQEIAINHPARVLSLTLVCSAPIVDSHTAAVVKTWRAQRPHCEADEFVLAASPWLFTFRFLQQPEALEAFLGMVRGNPFPQTVAGFQRQCDAVAGHNALARLGTIAAPTHVIVGSEDVLTPPQQSRALAERIPGARYTEVPALGHVLFAENPDAFNSALLQFLNAQPGPTFEAA
jgi:pimeloyl-ACP methyl ester carboxylesterase